MKLQLDSKLRGTISWVVAALVSLGGAMYSLVRWLDGHATDTELHAAIQKHNELYGAHLFLHDRVRYLSNQDTPNLQTRRDLEALYWILVGHEAADQVLPEQATTAARDARARFDAYVQRGDSLPTAFRKAVGRD